MRALVLAGGGSNGDGQIGFVDYLHCEEIEPGLHAPYDLYCGVSTGALTAAALAQFPAGREREAVRFMVEIYRGLKDNGSIYEKGAIDWPLNQLESNSLYDASPLHRLVREKLIPAAVAASGKRLAVGAVEIGLGTEEAYRTFVDPGGILLHQAVLASSAYPFGFQPVQIDGRWYSDGGLRRPIPLQDAIELGATDIDVVCTSPAVRVSGPLDPAKTNLVEMGLHYIDLLAAQVEAACLAVPIPAGVTVRVFRPSRDLGPSLSFGADKQSPHTHDENIYQGLQDARAQAAAYAAKEAA